MASHPALRHISKSSIKPVCFRRIPKQNFHLSPLELNCLSIHGIQVGLLFPKPPASSSFNTTIIIDRLKDSLSHTLVHFFPLAGNLVTHKQDGDSPCYSISLDYSPGGGVDFVHAVAQDVTMADILSSIDVHPIVPSFFLLNNAINHDGHTLPLLAVQVTELVDGIFIACSYNHVIGDGTSLWHFFNAWAEICRRNMVRNQQQQQHDHDLDDHMMMISHPPVIKRWFLDGHGPIINLPFSHHDEFIDRYMPPMVLRERIFHFSSQSVAKLKAKANAECNTSTISSFQALSALLWRSVTRARGRHLLSHQKVTYLFGIDIRSRLNPPLSPDYFGCYVKDLSTTATVEELLSHGIGWAAWLLHESVNGQTDSKVREELEVSMKTPSICQIYSSTFNPYSVVITNAPRFNVYGCDFGWGKAEAVRSGPGFKSDGLVTSFPGREGGGSVDLEVSLLPEYMSALESDPEFMDAVSTPCSTRYFKPCL